MRSRMTPWRMWDLGSTPHQAQRREACALDLNRRSVRRVVVFTLSRCNSSACDDSKDPGILQNALDCPKFVTEIPPNWEYETALWANGECKPNSKRRTGLLAEMAAFDSHVQSAAGTIQGGKEPLITPYSTSP